MTGPHAEPPQLSKVVGEYEVTLVINVKVAGVDEAGAQAVAMNGVSFSLPMSSAIQGVGVSSKAASQIIAPPPGLSIPRRTH